MDNRGSAVNAGSAEIARSLVGEAPEWPDRSTEESDGPLISNIARPLSAPSRGLPPCHRLGVLLGLAIRFKGEAPAG